MLVLLERVADSPPGGSCMKLITNRLPSYKPGIPPATPVVLPAVAEPPRNSSSPAAIDAKDMRFIVPPLYQLVEDFNAIGWVVSVIIHTPIVNFVNKGLSELR